MVMNFRLNPVIFFLSRQKITILLILIEFVNLWLSVSGTKRFCQCKIALNTQLTV